MKLSSCIAPQEILQFANGMGTFINSICNSIFSLQHPASDLYCVFTRTLLRAHEEDALLKGTLAAPTMGGKSVTPTLHSPLQPDKLFSH